MSTVRKSTSHVEVGANIMNAPSGEHIGPTLLLAIYDTSIYVTIADHDFVSEHFVRI